MRNFISTFISWFSTILAQNVPPLALRALGRHFKKIDIFLPNRPSRGVLLSLPRPKGALRRKRSANGKFQLGLADNPLKRQKSRKKEIWISRRIIGIRFRPALNSFQLAWKPFLCAERVGRASAGGAAGQTFCQAARRRATLLRAIGARPCFGSVARASAIETLGLGTQ
jgi:hypothetical protein